MTKKTRVFLSISVFILITESLFMVVNYFSARRALYEMIRDRWLTLQKQYDVRQLHFHLGPGSVSFLRVHKVSKFGDRMDGVRHTIVDANTLLVPAMGFETERGSSGIRGVVPVFATHPDTGLQVHVGALEVGTSFSLILKKIEQLSGSHFGVMLTREHMVKNMQPDFIAKHFAENPPMGALVVEESRYPEERKHFFSDPSGKELSRISGTAMLHMHGRMYGVTSFPLRDYRGTARPECEPVGMVLVWKDITESVQALWERMWLNVMLASTTFPFIEVILYYSLTFVTGRLEKVIDEQVGVIKEMAISDQLTGLYNRYLLEEMFAQVQARSNRSGIVFALVLFDLDFFKKINDTYGHAKGDEVLAWLGQFVKEQIRQDDVAFRFGNEEFLLLPDTPVEKVLTVCERLRDELAGSSVADLPVGVITISVGIAISRLDEQDTFDAISRRADSALYMAKDKGRNRVEIIR